jgi:hypothetical protein
MPASNKNIFAQIHGNVSGGEVLRLVWFKGKVTVQTKSTLGGDTVSINIVSDLSVGDSIEYDIIISDYHLTVIVVIITYAYVMITQ